MPNFYDQWLNYWTEEQEERTKARKSVHEEERQWVRTRQDYKTALLCARENGFVTAGAATISIIPKGWHSGAHSHGEEAMYILSGKGFTLLDGARYDWEKGACVFIPFGAIHQNFNGGDEEVQYLSFSQLALERFAGMAKFTQLEDAGQTGLGEPKGMAMAETDVHPEYGRIVLHFKDAPVSVGEEQAKRFAKRTDEFSLSIAKEMRTPGSQGHRSRVVQFMGDPENGFKAREVEITGILCDEPGKHSGKHAHMEALLYVLQGEGYSIVDDEKIPWKTGTLFHVPGPQSVHQHFNTSKVEAQHLRIHYGLRSHVFQPIAKRVFPYKYFEFGQYS